MIHDYVHGTPQAPVHGTPPYAIMIGLVSCTHMGEFFLVDIQKSLAME